MYKEMAASTKMSATIALLRKLAPTEGPMDWKDNSWKPEYWAWMTAAAFWCWSSPRSGRRARKAPSESTLTCTSEVPSAEPRSSFISDAAGPPSTLKFHSVQPLKSIPCRKPKTATAATQTMTRTAEKVKKILRLPMMLSIGFFLRVLGKDIQHKAGQGDGGEHGHDDTDEEGQREALHETGGEEVQDHGGDDGRSVRVADGRPGVAETLVHGAGAG